MRQTLNDVIRNDSANSYTHPSILWKLRDLQNPCCSPNPCADKLRGFLLNLWYGTRAGWFIPIAIQTGGRIVKPRILCCLLLISMGGCQSDRPRPLNDLVASMFQSRCPIRPIPPGTTYFDYDHGGGWFQVGVDGGVRPVPNPQNDVTQDPSPTPDR